MLREDVLQLFERNKGEILSGECIATDLQVTRAAIWKVINLLREEGYDIESIRKKGYRLNINSDILSTGKVADQLVKKEVLTDIRLYKTIDSTNKEAKRLGVEGIKHAVVIASEEQKEGKGKHACSFDSPSRKGIYMSVLLPAEVLTVDCRAITQMAGEAVVYAVKRLTSHVLTIEKQTDICHNGKKLGGILTEGMLELDTAHMTFIVVGIGIQVYDSEDTSEVAKLETSLGEVVGRYCNRSELIGEILNYFITQGVVGEK